jgi:hypothetical protein
MDMGTLQNEVLMGREYERSKLSLGEGVERGEMGGERHYNYYRVPDRKLYGFNGSQTSARSSFW